MPLRSYSKAELMLTERRRLERPLLVMTWLGIAAYCCIDVGESLFFLLAGTLAVVVNLIAAQHSREVSVHRMFVNAGVLVATGALLVELFVAHAPPISALGHYLILIQSCKLFERKTNRDYVQLIVLSMLLMLAASLRSEALWFAITLAAYLVLACYTTMVFVLKRGLDAAAKARLATESGPLEVHRVAWNVIRGWPGRAVLRRVVLVTLGLLATGAAVFLLSPRDRAAAMSFSGSDALGTTAFTDKIQLGKRGKIYLSQRVVMWVNISRSSRQSLPRSAFYLRAKTFDSYADSLWFNQVPGGASAQRPFAAQGPPEAMMNDVLVQNVAMSPFLAPSVFASHPAVKISAPNCSVRISAEMVATITPLTQSGDLLRYTAYCWPQPLNDEQRRYLADMRRQAYGKDIWPNRQIKIAPSVSRLARSWCSDLLDARDKKPEYRDQYDSAIAARIASRLQKQYTYTLDLSDVDPSRDGVEDFLFHTRKGHCEYFASALAVMCNALDVRARLAGGFLANPKEQAGDQIVVRQCDAHAWVEVFTPSTDWAIVDPSPPIGTVSEGWMQNVSRFWHAIQLFWQEKVLGYDDTVRQNLSNVIWSKVVACWDVVCAAWKSLREAVANLILHGQFEAPLLWLCFVLGLAGLGTEAIFLVRLMIRRAHRKDTDGQGVQPKRMKFIKKLFRLLERHGVPHYPEQTPLETARLAADKLNLPADVLVELVDLYYSLRWGHMAAQPQELRRAKAQVTHLAEMISTQRSRGTLASGRRR